MTPNPSRAGLAGTCLGLALLLGACASTPKVEGGGSGYLPSYDSLKEVSDAEGVKYLSSGPMRYRGDKVTRVYIAPSKLFPDGVRFPDIDAKTTSTSLQYFDATLRAQMVRHFTVVDTEDKAQLVIRPAVTRIAAVEEGRKPLDFVPVRLVTKPLKDAVLGTPQKSAAVLEVLVIDPRNGSVVNASYRPGVGKGIGRKGSENDKVSFESIQPVLDEWTRSIASETAKGLR